MKLNSVIHPDLLVAQKLAYEPNGLICSAIAQEAESKVYGACTFAWQLLYFIEIQPNIDNARVKKLFL